MQNTLLQTPIDYLKGVGPGRAEVLRKELGIHTYQDLINLFPNRYIDRTRFYKVSELQPTNAEVQIVGQITGFKEIAQKIYTTNPVDNQSVKDKVSFATIDNQYQEFDEILNSNYKRVPDVRGIPGMDALSLLENIGLKVKFTGVGKVKSQSQKKGEKLVKGSTIILKLS